MLFAFNVFTLVAFLFANVVWLVGSSEIFKKIVDSGKFEQKSHAAIAWNLWRGGVVLILWTCLACWGPVAGLLYLMGV